MRPPALPIPEAGIASDDPLGLSVDEESPTGEVLNQPPLEFERPPPPRLQGSTLPKNRSQLPWKTASISESLNPRSPRIGAKR